MLRAIFSDQSRDVEMPTALVEKLAEVIFLDLPLNGLERRRRPAQPQTLSAQFAAEGKSVENVLSKLPALESEKLRAKISHLHKSLNHASPTAMAEMLKRGGAHVQLGFITVQFVCSVQNILFVIDPSCS